MAFLRWIVGFILSVVVAALAVMNRNMVDVVISPVHPAFSIPLYMVFLPALAAGFLIGGVVMWLNTAGLRREKRQQKKAIRLLTKEVEGLKEDRFTSSPPAQEIFSSVPTLRIK